LSDENKKDEDKYGDTSIWLILFLAFAIFLSIVFGWDDNSLPEQDQIDASPFETHGFEKDDNW
jgi:hypothetical protein